VPKKDSNPRTVAALNDIAAGLQHIETALCTLEANEDDRAAFQRFANRVSSSAKRRVTAEALREHLEARNGREQMTLVDWMEFSF